jgi:hypothetical protein
MKTITLDLDDNQAEALAQFTKRITYDAVEAVADRHDGGAELDDMRAGLDKLQRALAEAGFAPR